MAADDASAVLVCAVEGLSLTAAEEDFFRSEQPAGLTLFRRNIPQDDWHRVSGLITRLQSQSQTTLMVAIDQEGGRVSRMPAGFPNRGPAQALFGGASDDVSCKSLEDYGREIGLALRSVGINVNFAPVLDILSEPTNIAIGDRVFGTTPEDVCLRAGAWLTGLHSTGVMGCLKHFPGQGDAKVDTHEGAAVIDLPRDTLDRRELVPFRALTGKSPMVMIAHCIYPSLSSVEASRSPQIIGSLLRGEMRYDGVVVSDDMNMGAIAQDEKSWQAALVQAISAGVDMLLVCRHLERCVLALEALRREAARSKSFADRLRDAAQRVGKLRSRLVS